jgi:hypothetical protein
MTVKKIAVATKSFKPLIQKPDKKRKATDDNEDDDLINIIKSTNHKKPKQAKKKGMTEESCETITENTVANRPGMTGTIPEWASLSRVPAKK